MVAAPVVAVAPTVAPSIAAVARRARVVPVRHDKVAHAPEARARGAVAARAVAAPAIAVPTPHIAVERPSVGAVAHVAAPIPTRIAKAPVTRVPKKSIARIARTNASAHAPIVEVEVGQAAAPQPFARIAFAPHQAGPPVAAHSLATLAIPFAPDSKALKQRKHRFGVAYVHVAPKVERTPEPPIGYDSRPGLLRVDPPVAGGVSTNAP